MAYKLKIVLGKRSYRKGPTNSTMKRVLSRKDRRVRNVARHLGS